MLINTRLALNVWIENREKWEEIKEQINKTFHCILCILILSNFYDWIKISLKLKLYTALWHKRYSKLNNIFVNINFYFYCWMIEILYHKILKYMNWSHLFKCPTSSSCWYKEYWALAAELTGITCVARCPAH